MTLGVESFAVAVDDPADVYGDLRGERIPFGFDLEWETDGSVYPWIGSRRYEIPCHVHGEILVGAARIDFDGLGMRDPTRGARAWLSLAVASTPGAPDHGPRFHTPHLRLPRPAHLAPAPSPP